MRLVKYRGYWCAAWVEEGGTVRRSLRIASTESRERAERALIDFKAALRKPAETVADIVDLYLADKDETATSPARLRDAWKPLKPFFGHLRPEHVTRQLCRDYAAQRRQGGRQDGTIRKELGTLRAALRWHNKATPAVVELPPMPPPRDRVLTRAEVDKLIAAADAPHVKLAIRLLWATAARKEAILGLQWSQVDFERGIIRLAQDDDGKKRKNRGIVPFGPRLRGELTEAKAAALTDYVIEWGARRVKAIRTGFDRACRVAGLKDVSPHVLRHSAAVAMVEAGRPMDEVGQLLGHSDVSVTYRIYARYSPDHLRETASVLD
ncbi:tyrosine-type recombinase/integrase [Niveispirillum cyanobacteriorum]|uniref:Integrase n=1 Tax=Niveispirillum cyanobacteriorum TaxID=1612173 RepID=A0A2K9NFX5_9PROT|nr:site-specific integrase [Niveispirillum cyanobacteriorum]AUN31999.1 integrase [Niveispirillum cyanobacteriorum]GGE85081.1 integrase [Niveispirillum cyanobacteriorum]